MSIIGLVGLRLADDAGPDVSPQNNPLLGAASIIGSPSQLVEHFQNRLDMGFERAYVWLVGAGPEVITAFGETVIPAFSS